MSEIGQIVYMKRLEKGMTQVQLSKRTGVPQANLSNIEKGKRDVTVSTLRRISYALDTRLRDLIDDFEVAGSRKRVHLSRPAIERLARAIVRDGAKLTGEETEIVHLFKEIVPSARRRYTGTKKLHQAWFGLKRRLGAKEIQAILRRVEDARQRLK